MSLNFTIYPTDPDLVPLDSFDITKMIIEENKNDTTISPPSTCEPIIKKVYHH